MPDFKATLRFNYISAFSSTGPVHRAAGWTESYYATDAAVTNILAKLLGVGAGPLPAHPLAVRRAAMLPSSISIVGFRIQQINPLALAQSFTAVLAGGINTSKQDIPQLALQYRVPASAASNIRRCTLRGIVDDAVIEGELTGNVGGYFDVIQQFLASLLGWKFQGRDLSQPTQKILTVDGTGSALMEVNPVMLTQGDFVRVSRTMDTTKKFQGGRFRVAQVGPDNLVKLTNWTAGSCTGGTLRKDAKVLVSFDPSQNMAKDGLVVTRRVGRPFLSYRGRRSKRR